MYCTLFRDREYNLAVKIEAVYINKMYENKSPEWDGTWPEMPYMIL
jgi:hypothetical protein